MKLKGYYTHYGYMGITPTGRRLFSSENEYVEYMKELESET